MPWPQIIAAAILLLLVGYHGFNAVRLIALAILRHGMRYAGRPAARSSAVSLLSMVTPVAWAGLLWWGGFWS